MIPPLPFEPEELVIVEIIDGYANTTNVHLPATRCNQHGATFESFEFPPTQWPPRCGHMASGSVYVRAGLLENSVVCASCLAVAA